MYIYKLGTECDGAQMRVSDVYIPTLVALLGLCFDPSECFQDLRIWSGVMGNKSSKLQYMSRIVTVTPGGLRGLGLKGGAVPPGVHPAIPPSPLMFPSTIMGTHTCNLPCMCNRGYIPTRGYILTSRHLEGCLLDVVSMRGWAIG